MAKCGTANNYPTNQCTYWADKRYHQLAGCYVPWSGDAHSWRALAAIFSWQVSSKPIVPSIMCLQGGVQGASLLGHVGVVESINSDGSFITSNLNWGPNFKAITNVKHTPGNGVSFLSVPGKTLPPEPPKPPAPGTTPPASASDTTAGLGAGLSVGLLALAALAVVGVAVYFIFTA